MMLKPDGTSGEILLPEDAHAVEETLAIEAWSCEDDVVPLPGTFGAFG